IRFIESLHSPPPDAGPHGPGVDPASPRRPRPTRAATQADRARAWIDVLSISLQVVRTPVLPLLCPSRTPSSVSARVRASLALVRRLGTSLEIGPPREENKMSQLYVERIIGVLATDEALRRRFIANPKATLLELAER